MLMFLPKRGEVAALYDLGQHMTARGFSENEIMDALIKLTHEKEIELLPGNRLRVLGRSKHQSTTPPVRLRTESEAQRRRF